MIDLKVLRQVHDLDLGTIDYLTARDQLFADGNRQYVDNDTPRNEEITSELIVQTQGFVLADQYGNIVPNAAFTDLAQAEKARASATVTFNYQVDVPSDESETTEDTTSNA